MPISTPVSARKPIGLSEVAARRIRHVTVAAVTLLAAGSAVLSFSGLQVLAVESGIHPNLAWLLPFIIDGLVLTGSLGVVTATLVGTRTWYFWVLTLFGVVASTAGNVAAAPDDLVAQLVHATPPITFALAIEGLLRVYRASAEATPASRLAAALRPAHPHEAKPSPAPAATASAPAPAPPTAAPAPAPPAAPASVEPTARQRLAALLAAEPTVSGGEAARRLNIDPSHARKLLRDLRPTTEGTP